MSVEPSQENADLMTRFLLDQLSEEERRAVEERFLTDDEYFAQLLVMEDSLIDDYVLGRLSGDERKNAELLFESSSAQKRKVKFTESLIDSLKNARAARTSTNLKQKRALVTDEIVAPKTSPWLKSQASLNLIARGFQGLPKVFSATAGLVVLLVVVASIYLIFEYRRQTRQLLAQQTALERSVLETRQKLDAEMRSSAELEKRLNSETEKRTQAEEALAQSRSPEPRLVASVVLLPTIFQRGAGSKTVTVPPGASRLQLLLDVASDPPYPKYNVGIKTFDGRNIWARDSVPASQIKQNKLSLTLSSSLFPYDDYRIELHGVSEDGTSQLVADYAFKVRK